MHPLHPTVGALAGSSRLLGPRAACATCSTAAALVMHRLLPIMALVEKLVLVMGDGLALGMGLLILCGEVLLIVVIAVLLQAQGLHEGIDHLTRHRGHLTLQAAALF